LQGDIVKILDEDGNEKASYVYNAWGNILSQSEDELSSINPLRYRGYVYDEDTTLYYLQTRYYDPTTGRFINADDTVFISSSGTAIGDSIYTYCENEPVNRSDAEGTCYFDIKDNIKHFNSEYRLDFIKIGEKKRENTIESLQLENGFICVIINTLGL
jgi:RHS repeat-associated protein